MALSLPSRGAWIEIITGYVINIIKWSLPSRGAWIEIPYHRICEGFNLVAPLAGSVDRNMYPAAGGG